MLPEQLHLIGEVTRLHGFRGELTVFMDTAVPGDYKDLEFLFLKVRGTTLPYEVELFEQKTRNTAKVKLKGVDDEATARGLIKAEVYVDRSKLTTADEVRIELRDLAGYEVVDQSYGRVGKLLQVLELSGNPQLEIEHPRGIVLVPLQQEFILSIDEKKKQIHVAAPEGLIELYVGNNS